MVFGHLYPIGERGLNGRHLPICSPAGRHPRHEATRGPEHERITLRSVRRTHQRRETIGDESKIGVRPVAIDAGCLFVQPTSGQLIRQSWVSTQGRHGHPHPTDDAGNDADGTSSFLGTGQEAATAVSHRQRLLRQLVRHLIELARHTEIVAERQDAFTACTLARTRSGCQRVRAVQIAEARDQQIWRGTGRLSPVYVVPRLDLRAVAPRTPPLQITLARQATTLAEIQAGHQSGEEPAADSSSRSAVSRSVLHQPIP